MVAGKLPATAGLRSQPQSAPQSDGTVGRRFLAAELFKGNQK
jgi:hypothetical protein